MVLSQSYEYNGGIYTRSELKATVEGEAKDLDPEQWQDGEFSFDEWLSDSIAVGSVKRASL